MITLAKSFMIYSPSFNVIYVYDYIGFVAFYDTFDALSVYSMTTFGDNLKAARVQKGVSQGQLADMMGIHSTHISRYERNQTIPSVDVVKKLADLLEVSADVLVYGSVDEKVRGRIQDDELLTMFTKAQSLDEDDRKSIKAMLKAFIFQKDLEQKLAQ